MFRAWREFCKPSMRCARIGCEVVKYQRKGTRRSSRSYYVAESVTQERDQCCNCQDVKTEWSDLPDTVRGFTGYSAPSDQYERALYGGGDWSEPYRAALPTDTVQPVGGVDREAFQARVLPWLMECFGADIAANIEERCDRFIEEALEQVQALGWDKARAIALVDYVYGRPAGEPHQEAGGVMVTFAALCQAAGLDMQKAGDDELARIMRPEIVQKIRAKQAAKPTGSALPVALYATAPTAPSSHTGEDQ